MNKDDLIFVAGHRGLVGAAIVRELRSCGYENLLLKTRQEVDLSDETAVKELFWQEKPAVVIDAAAKVGGILANDSFPADFIRENLQVQTNLIDTAYRTGAKKFVFLGSSCIYPRLAKQPIKEDELLSGPLESTNESYAVAKIAGVKMCQAYRKQFGFNAISLMPTNLYGPGDNFDLATSHVLPALIRKFHEAKESGSRSVEIWGTGTPKREFLFVTDLANAVVFLTENYDEYDILNVGTGTDVSIRDLALLIAETTGFDGQLKFDKNKPDGAPRKLLDVSRLQSYGWQPKWSLQEGISATYEWFANCHLREVGELEPS
jgi:GDP-L-fucose synthase